MGIRNYGKGRPTTFKPQFVQLKVISVGVVWPGLTQGLTSSPFLPLIASQSQTCRLQGVLTSGPPASCLQPVWRQGGTETIWKLLRTLFAPGQSCSSFIHHNEGKSSLHLVSPFPPCFNSTSYRLISSFLKINHLFSLFSFVGRKRVLSGIISLTKTFWFPPYFIILLFHSWVVFWMLTGKLLNH